ncbi:hypothetical protein CAP40_08950 [Sphingomonas sp. IBVSS2]|uniref:hypothetical protein n=1 Tax=Sphingomonas sp. IBVSS2 TaxID=1985172 RepID=UPI000A2E47DE|nr:hypothetical protein [Sphingomonas sp. IBVSS2]OSZ68673.1 hypothetical protein CAP40_08950 [Sphingomonas sp. IBVSS2]
MKPIHLAALALLAAGPAPAVAQQQNPTTAATVATPQGKRVPRPIRAASPSPLILAKAGMAMVGKWLRAFIH